MRRKFQICTLLLAAAALSACGESEPESEPEPQADAASDAATAAAPAAPPTLEEKLASAARPAADRARDGGRKPAAVVEFLGIGAGDRVIDVIAAGGYYTEVLSRAVGPEGSVTAQNPPAVLEFRDGANEKALSERLADGRLPNVTRLDKDFQEIVPSDGPFDAALTALNFHDIYNGSGPEAAVAVLESVHSVLKPGGVLGIIDHVGVAGNDNRSLHRVRKSHAVESAEAAGFVLEDQSDLLANPEDDHTEGVFTEGLRGHTDRFLLKFTKPAASDM